MKGPVLRGKTLEISGKVEDDSDESDESIDPRAWRILELAYRVEGVVGAKVWMMPNQVALGLVVGRLYAADAVIARVSSITAGQRAFEEKWDFGLLQEGSS